MKVIPEPKVEYISVDMWILITGGPDRDIYLPVQDQLQQSPQPLLQLNIPRLLNRLDPETENLDEFPQSPTANRIASPLHPKRDVMDRSVESRRLLEQADIFRHVAECIIG